MDTQTIFVVTGVAFLVFAVLLVVAERPRADSPLALLVTADALFAVGVLLQSQRATIPFVVSVFVGNVLTWIGLQYQFWGALAMSGRPSARRIRLIGAVATVALGAALALLPDGGRSAAGAVLYAVFFGLTAWALLTWRVAPPALRGVSAGLFVAVTALYLIRAGLILLQAIPAQVIPADGATDPIAGMQYLLIFACVLSGAFSLLLLSKQATEARMSEVQQVTQVLLDTLPTGVAITADGLMSRVNPALARMLGYDVSELEGQPATTLFANGEDYDTAATPILAELERSGEYEGELDLHDREGRVRLTWLQVTAIDWSPQGRRAVFAVTDVTGLRELQAEVARQAAYDDLTGLLNRRAFLQRARLELSRSARNGRPFALAALDLDRLKMINDGYGHAVGDAALLAVAAAFRETFRDIDLTARIGGDEFAVILPDSTIAQANAAMERFLANLAGEQVLVDGYHVELGASVGVAEHQDAEELDALMARADRAMYASKRRGGHTVTAKLGDVGI